MTAELAKVINDGLYFYEQELQDQRSKVEYYAVSKRENKKLSYLQRKCTSNVAVLYGTDGISVWNRMGIDHQCDRQTANVGLVAPSVESI